MPGLDVDLPSLKFSARAEVLHKPGAVRLCHIKYPHLVHAPDQWGSGIRTEDHGVEVRAICEAIAVNPDYAAVAAQLGTTPEHVRQAVAYAIETGYATT